MITIWLHSHLSALKIIPYAGKRYAHTLTKPFFVSRCQLLIQLILVVTLWLPHGTTARPLSLSGKAFSATWNDKNGQLYGISTQDASGRFQLVPQDVRCFGELCILDGRRTWTTSRAQLDQPPQITRKGDVQLLSVSARLRAQDGSLSPWHLKETFYIYPEGAIFCDFSLSLPKTAHPTTVTKCILRFPIYSGRFTKFRWFWKRDWRGKLYLERSAGLHEKGYLSVMGASIARQTVGYTNHIEIFLERNAAFARSNAMHMAATVSPEKSGVKEFIWTLYKGDSIIVRPGYEYNNRWGIAIASARRNDNAIGQRVAHWQEGNSGLMTYPSDSAVQAMADCGTSVCVLHLYWKSPDSWSKFNAYDEKEMARWVATCHKYGIRCLLYTIPIDKPGDDGINHESYDRYHCDGLYFDYGSVHFRGDRPNADMPYYKSREFPAMDYLNLTRHYRNVVGPDGIMVAHAGTGAPDALFCLNMNAYLSGEAIAQVPVAGDNLDAAYYQSGLQYATADVWCVYKRFQTPEAVANYAAIGAFPHVLFGRGTHSNNNYPRSLYVLARFTLPYWQMLRCIPMDRKTTMYNELTGSGATCDLRDAHCVVYRRSPKQMLVIVSNIGKPDSGKVTLNTTLLQPAANLQLYRIKGRDIAELQIEDLGYLRGATIPTGSIGHREYEAFLLIDQSKIPETQRVFAKIRKLVSMFRDHLPPNPVGNLRAVPEAGGVRLSWNPATDNSHITQYRIFRGQGIGRTTFISTVEETTTYVDYTAPPGAKLTYEIVPIDVSKNQGPPRSVTIATPVPDAVALDMPHVNHLKPLNGDWEKEGAWYVETAHRRPASAKGTVHKIDPVRARFIRVYFTGGCQNRGNAHVVEMEARDGRGNRIKPIAAFSSGSAPGHPAQDVMDGKTDKMTNGWWSDPRKGLPASVGLDFGVPVTINSLWLLTYWDGVRYYHYMVQVSMDGRKWQLVAGTKPATPLARAFYDVNFKDGEIGVTTYDPPPERSGGGILFRCPDANNGYAVYLTNNLEGALCFAKLVNGKLKIIKRLFFPYSRYNPIPHRIRVRARGTEFTCYCDTVKAFEVKDDTFSSGKVGIFNLTGIGLKFNNLFLLH